MNESSPSLAVRVLVSVVQVSLILGIPWWFTRRNRKEFRLSRVFIVSVCSAVSAGLLFAAWWWFAPYDADRQSSLLLAAVFVPLYTLLGWGFVIARRGRHKKHEHPTPQTDKMRMR